MKKKIVLILVALVIIGTVVFSSVVIIEKRAEKINQQEIENSTHGIVIGDEVPFYEEPEVENVKQLKLLKKGEKVYILDEIEENDIEWYKIKVDGKINGYVRADAVEYYKENKKEKVLVVDVSQFNMEYTFEKEEDFEVFIVENEISYVYIRAGGRGYGEEGKFYEDRDFQMYINACEYLNVPYGFYFLEEALNSDEIDEEVDFIKNFLRENKTKRCVLPVALDVETHDGKGRADNIWKKRYKLVQELIDKLNKENIDNIVYTNAQTANLYLTKLRTKFWIAYYPEENKVPNYWYFDTEQPGASNTKLQKKTVGWQFTEHGAGDEIAEDIDVSLFKKDFYKNKEK